MALLAAIWLFALLMIAASLVFGAVSFGLAKKVEGNRPLPAVVLGSLLPSLFGIGAAIELHPGWSLLLTSVAVLFSVWWLNNMAQKGS